ncbi:AlbA family DNA-binding domain-containing protein [Streptomyces murinus]|uniref:Schlafen AlbA-2 domain-containing protein n=1 Tax=Streptomyces murinus TaxID=33900 RepID=A0A7W3RID9_STRMR|nr:hypothetical protein [Streptomyces murinus]
MRELVGVGQPESLTLEYKENYAAKIPDSVAAMANSYGGLIMVGVTERNIEDRIVGVPEDTIVKIVSGCHQKLEPPWEPEIVPVPLPETDGLMVLVVRVDPAKAPRPLLIQGAAPIRLHGRNAVADRSRLAHLLTEAATQPAAAGIRLPPAELPHARTQPADSPHGPTRRCGCRCSATPHDVLLAADRLRAVHGVCGLLEPVADAVVVGAGALGVPGIGQGGVLALGGRVCVPGLLVVRPAAHTGGVPDTVVGGRCSWTAVTSNRTPVVRPARAALGLNAHSPLPVSRLTRVFAGRSEYGQPGQHQRLPRPLSA